MTAIQRKIKVSDLEDRLRAAEAAVEESQKAVIECTEAYMSLQKITMPFLINGFASQNNRTKRERNSLNGCCRRNLGINRTPNFVSYDLRTFF